MTRFIAIYTGTAAGRAGSGWDDMSEHDRRARESAGMQAWGEWMAANAASLVDAGGPLGATKRVSKQGIADVQNELVGYVIVEAESHDDAARLFEGHPHFSIFPGEAVEIMECLPLPG